MIGRTLRRLNRKNVIIGGGPAGSNVAMQLARQKQEVTLIHKSCDLGAHNDVSRLARLALDGSNTEYKLSQQSIIDLLAINEIAQHKIITSKPGVLFIASPETLFANKVAVGTSYDKELKQLTQAEVNQRFNGYAFSFPHNTLFWYHPIGYVVNPAELSKANRQVAVKHGAEIIDAEATILASEQAFEIHTDENSYHTQNLFLLAGANNKELLGKSNLAVNEFKDTYLTAISTIRYMNKAPCENLMPITIGNIYLPGIDHNLDFSTMPESTDIIKVRLSGPTGSEIVDYVKDKNKLSEEPIQAAYKLVIGNVLPKLVTPIDFNRCITYRNRNPEVTGLSFLHVKSSTRFASNELNLITTLGCYGVQVKYGSLVGKAISDYALKTVTHEGVKVFETRVTTRNYIKEMLPIFSIFLDHAFSSKPIGRTSVKKLSDNLFLKMEGENYSGSIKDRVALYVLLKKISTNTIKNGDTLVLATSGSYGIAILSIKKLIEQYLKIHFNVVIITPYAYREKDGIRLLRSTSDLATVRENDFDLSKYTGKDVLLLTEGMFDQSIEWAKKLKDAKNFYYLDQHHDDTHMKAHESTAKELIQQLPEVTDVIAVTGTGATAMGLRTYLPKNVKVHSRPAKSGEISGLTDARKYNNFFKAGEIEGYDGTGFLGKEESKMLKSFLKFFHNIDASDSTGAAMLIANEVKENNPDAVIAVISPSHAF